MLQDKAGSMPAESLLLALLEQYLKRVTVNRMTLTALFTAADSTGEGLLDRPRMKAAFMCARPDITDTALTTIWVEREKVSSLAPAAEVMRLNWSSPCWQQPYKC